MNRKLFFTLVVGVAALSVRAQEGGAPVAPGAKEKKEKPTPAIEYTQKVTKLNTIQTRITDANAEFSQLISRKEHASDEKEVDSILKQMVEISKQRNKDVEEYNKVFQETSYRYPSKNVELNRLYELEQKRNVDEMQSVADLDEMLTRVKKVIERKFAPLNPEPEKTLTVAPAEPDEPPKKLRLEK